MNRKKKVALIIYSLNMGGAEKVVSDLSFQFARQYDVYLILFDSSLMYYPYTGQMIDLGLPSQTGFMGKVFNLAKRSLRLRRLFREQQFDHVISFMENANFPALLASRKVIVSNHCNPNTFSPLEWLFVKWLYPRAKKVMAVSRRGMEIFRDTAHLNNVGYLYNPINLKRIKAQSDGINPIQVDGEYIVAVGRLSAEKDFSRLISAYAKSHAKQQYKLVILGEGEQRAQLEKQRDDLGLQDQVLLPGFVTNPYPTISQARFLVLSSLHEGFPVTLLEALAMGCPVLATNCETGPSEIITHEQNGLLVPPADTQSLTEGIDRLASDQDFYQHVKQHTSSSVSQLDITAIAPRWLEI